MTSEWPNTGIVLASQKDFVAIGIEVLTLDVEVLKNGEHLFHWWRWGQSIQEFYLSNDAIPVGLRIFRIGMTTGVELFRYTTRIIHHDGELVLTWFEHFR